MMTTLTVNIDNKKSEKAVKAVLDVLGLTYNVVPDSANVQHALNKSEQKIYEDLKSSLEEIKLYQEGKIELRDAREFINQL